ncbi:unnamed protein product, partial [Closterium sp. NIES-54]
MDGSVFLAVPAGGRAATDAMTAELPDATNGAYFHGGFDDGIFGMTDFDGIEFDMGLAQDNLDAAHKLGLGGAAMAMARDMGVGDAPGDDDDDIFTHLAAAVPDT